MTRDKILFLVLSATIALNACADYRLPGGSTTVFDASREAFAQPADNLDPRSLARFFSGDTLFNTNWVSASSVVKGRDGLGPLFNTRSCSACHFKDGRGRPPEPNEIPSGLLVRISVPGNQANGAPLPHPVYGNQISVRSLPETKPEADIHISYQESTGSYPDGSEYRIQKPAYTFSNWGYGDTGEFLSSPRVAPSVFGLGLLDRIPDEAILARADSEDQDQDGISGRPNWVWSVSQQKKVLGKYGWKANKASLLDQSAAAFQGDIGITSQYFPTENYSLRQSELERFPSGGDPELETRDLEDVVFYLNSLAPPASRFNSEVEYQSGLALFTGVQCASCHTPEYQTGKSAQLPFLSDQTIYPYTDLLLHDMGEGLADNRPDFEASGREWRTPPLWGIGLIQTVNRHNRLLHDGRARSIEEAILWHGGEATASRNSYMALPLDKRQSLVDFVKAL